MNAVTARRPTFPRLPLFGVALVIGILLVTVAGLRISGWRPSHDYAAAVASRDLKFADQDDGGIAVRDAATGGLIDTLAPGTNGFIRATVRGLVTERKHQGIGPERPFVLTAREDGALTLQDPATGRTLDLEAFGPTNAGAFANFLPGKPAAQ